MFFLLIYYTVIHCTLVTSSDHVITVDANTGNNTLACLKSNKQPCKTLEYVQSKLRAVAEHSVVIDICDPQINLTTSLNFTDFIELTIKGEENSTNIVCNTSNIGLSFINVIGLTLDHIQLTDCGAIHSCSICGQHTQQNKVLEISALYIFHCKDVNISHCTLRKSKGTGISMIDTYGDVFIEHTDVLQSYFEGNKSMCGGSGLHIAFSSRIDNDGKCSIGQRFISAATYNIDKCNFVSNIADVSRSLLSNLTSFISNTMGGGATIHFGLEATNILINIFKSVFKDNYSGLDGGGLYLVNLNSTTRHNQVILSHTYFLNNHAHYLGGGGIMIFVGYGAGKMSLISCEFVNNSAAGGGGGVSISSVEEDAYNLVEFTNCSWTENTALHGSAVHMMPWIVPTIQQGPYPTIVFINCSISGNRVIPVTDTQSNASFYTQIEGTGAVFSNRLSIEFRGNTKFENNNGTALYLSCSVASFQASSNVVFNHNHGKNGGGISLVGRSYLYLNGSSNFSFVKNTARQLGGGIYFKGIDDIIYQPCFIYSDHMNNSTKSRFNFYKNRAHSNRGQGNDIFASSYSSCKLFCHGSIHIYDCIGVFNFSDKNSTATNPTNYSIETEHSGRVQVFPGLSTILPLHVTDSEGNEVFNVSYEATMFHSNKSVSIDKAFQYVSANTIQLHGKSRENATIRLDTILDTSLFIDVTLTDCPPGYIHNDSKCTCSTPTYYGMVKCEPEVFIRRGIWMGNCSSNSTALCTSDCPIGYCTHNNSQYVKLPRYVSELESFICSKNRHGTICGSCTPGHSAYYNSWVFACGVEDQCHLGIFYYFLSTIIPLTILFIIITLLDMNFAKGWNGFILYAQVVNAFYIYGYGAITFSNIQLHILNWLMFVYSFFNLEIFNINQLSFCLWKGANVMDILMMKLGSICFALALVMVTVWVLKQRRLTKCFPCIPRRRYSVINGISTFLILCYSQCARVCLQVLNTGCLYDENYKCIEKVVFLHGNTEIFKGGHFKYATVALTLIVLIVTLPPVLLLFYPLCFRILGVCKLSETRVVMCLWRMMPIQLLDSFQNQFKDNYRFFAGLYFLYRAIPLLIYGFSENIIQYFACVELILGIIIVLHSIFQPYKNRLYNITDQLLFLNLVIIKGISLYNYVISTEATNNVEMEGTVSFWCSIQIILLFIPLIIVGLILIMKLVIKNMNRNGYRTIEPMPL